MSQFSELLSAAVDDANADANLMQQGQFFGKRDQHSLVFSHFAGKLGDKSLSLETLNIWQGLTKQV